MKNILPFFMMLLFLASCKNEKKKSSIIEKKVDVVKKEATFENSLLDLRDVNKDLIEGFGVQKFGMQKVNDSIYAFVFKLDNTVTNETVGAYSVGIRGFQEDKNVLQFPSSPNIKTIEDNNYLILRRKLENITYLDSIDVYIYERRNWKKSGKLGGFRLRDIVFEDE